MFLQGVKYRDWYWYEFAGNSNFVTMPEKFWVCGNMHRGKLWNEFTIEANLSFLIKLWTNRALILD